MVMTSGLNHGIRKTVPHLVGIIIGFPTMVACIGLGLGAIFLKYPLLHQAIKICGIVYLLYLAWKIANAGNPEADSKLKEPFTFLQAAAFQWLNPKAWVIAIGAIATFTTVGNVELQLAIILLGFFSMGAISMTLWLLLGSSLKRLLHSQRELRIFNICMAILLALSVISIAFSEIGTSA